MTPNPVVLGTYRPSQPRAAACLASCERCSPPSTGAAFRFSTPRSFPRPHRISRRAIRHSFAVRGSTAFAGCCSEAQARCLTARWRSATRLFATVSPAMAHGRGSRRRYHERERALSHGRERTRSDSFRRIPRLPAGRTAPLLYRWRFIRLDLAISTGREGNRTRWGRRGKFQRPLLSGREAVAKGTLGRLIPQHTHRLAGVLGPAGFITGVRQMDNSDDRESASIHCHNG